MPAPQGLPDYGWGAFGYLEICQFCFCYPSCAARIVGRAEDSSGRTAEVIHQHEVILENAGCIVHDALEDFQQAEDFNFQSCLFAYFAAQCRFEEFARFHGSAGQRPPPFQRLSPALDEKNAVAFDNQRADTNDGVFRILAANIATLPSHRVSLYRHYRARR